MAVINIMKKQIPWICPLMFPLKATYIEIKKKNKVWVMLGIIMIPVSCGKWEI